MNRPYEIKPIPRHGKVCELPMCIPVEEAAYEVSFPDGTTVLICQKHADGILALEDYLSRSIITLEPLDTGTRS